MQTVNKLFVYPTSRAIRESIKKIDSNSFLPTSYTIDEFINKAIKVKNRRFIDENERILFLKEATKNINLEKLGISKDFFRFLKDSQYIFRFFGEISHEKIDINRLDSFDTYEFYNEHITILKAIYKNYSKLLDSKSLCDKINIVNLYEINYEFLERFSSIEIFYEGYFTQYEFDIIKEISEKFELIINFHNLKYNQKSINKFSKLGFEFKIDFSYKINLSKLTILEETPFIKRLENIKIKSFVNPINQIAFIKKTITNFITNGIEASKIALILPNEDFTKALELFDVENYFNYAMGKSIENRLFFKRLNYIYDYLNEDDIKNIDALEVYSIDFEFINSFKEKFSKNVTKDLVDSLFNYLLLNEENSELKEKINETLYNFNNLIFKNAQQISTKEYLKLIIQELKEITLDDINSGKITVMGLLESRYVEFDGLIICDFNESYVPKKSIKDKFLSTSIKESINLPTSCDRENLQKYYYYRVIQKAKYLAISYVNNETENISRFASDIFSNTFIDNKTYDKEYAHILFRNNKIKHYNDEVIKEIDLSKRSWSASSLKTFLECKRKYYLKYLCKVDEHTISLKPKGSELGNLIHKILEKIYKNHTLLDLSFDLVIKYVEEESIKNPFLILDKEIFLKRLNSFIELEQSRYNEKIEVLELEKSFSIDYNGINLNGKIDRIDKVKELVYLIDYKTSSNLKIDSKRSLENTTDFQLEFYYLAAKELYKNIDIKAFYYDLYNCSLKEEVLLDEKLLILDEKLNELKTTEVNFNMCEKSSTCQFCDYKIICDR